MFSLQYSFYRMQSAMLLYQFRPSVSPSHCGIVSKQMHIIRVFPRVSLVFDRYCYCCYKISRGTPSACAVNTRGWEKFAIFDRNCHLSQKRYENRPMVTMDH